MNKLIAYCGLNCDTCEARIATINNDDNLKELVAKKWSELNNVLITKEMINCVGCRMDGVKTPFCDSLCPIRKCATLKEVATCKECDDLLICDKIQMIIGNNDEAKSRLLNDEVLETERLLFRRITPDDFNNIKEIISDQETMKYYPKPYDDDGVNRWINWCLGCYKKRGFGLFAVILKETGEFIGDTGITLQNINGRQVFEIGYHYNKKYWHKGYASEATQFMRDYYFKNNLGNEVYSYMTKANKASENVAIRNKMTFVEEYLSEGVPHLVYRITKKEWLSIKEKCE